MSRLSVRSKVYGNLNINDVIEDSPPSNEEILIDDIIINSRNASQYISFTDFEDTRNKTKVFNSSGLGLDGISSLGDVRLTKYYEMKNIYNISRPKTIWSRCVRSIFRSPAE
jgi:hypothetical protein